MALPLPAYALKVQIAPDSSGSAGTYASPSNQQDYKVALKFENADITQDNSAGYRQRLPTLTDANASLDLFVDFADTAQTTLRNAGINKVPVWVKAFITATNSIIFQALVTDLSFDEGPADVSKMACSLVMAGTGASPLTVA